MPIDIKILHKECPWLNECKLEQLQLDKSPQFRVLLRQIIVHGRNITVTYDSDCEFYKEGNCLLYKEERCLLKKLDAQL